MKNFLLICLSFVVVTANYSQTGNSEAEAKDPGRFLSRGTYEGDYSSAIFTNKNLSVK